MSNAAAISLIPELLEYNISYSVSISSTYSISMTNNASYDRQVGVYRKYKIVIYNRYSSQGNEYCEYLPNRTYKIYVGYKLDWI